MIPKKINFKNLFYKLQLCMGMGVLFDKKGLVLFHIRGSLLTPHPFPSFFIILLSLSSVGGGNSLFFKIIFTSVKLWNRKHDHIWSQKLVNRKSTAFRRPTSSHAHTHILFEMRESLDDCNKCERIAIYCWLLFFD